MKTTKTLNIARLAAAAFTGLLLTGSLHGEIRSKSNELIVMQPQDLPGQAQMPGNSFFLYSSDQMLQNAEGRGDKLNFLDVSF